MVKIGINGFGRIGRMILRACSKKQRETKCASQDIPYVVAINDPFLTTEHMANLLKYDSTHGLFQGEITVYGSCLKVDGQVIEVINERNPEKVAWGRSCAQYVVDATGLYKTKEKASVHLRESVERVLLTYPSKSDVPMFVFGVNHGDYNLDMKIVSNASCTTNCLAPVAKVLHENFTINSGLMTTIHAVTASQNSLDGPSKRDFRIGRGAFQNIVPTTTGAAKAIGTIIPELAGKLTGLAARVPVPNGSLVDLTCNISTGADYDMIKCRMKEAADGPLQGILGYTEEQIVSSDIIGDSRSSIFDARAGLSLTPNFVKIIAWYDNEWGYSCRVVDLLKYMASRECK